MLIDSQKEFVKKGMAGFGALGIIAVIVAALVLIGGGYIVYQRFTKPVDTRGTACTQEAKLCPDGSYVSRTGPNCEFAQCPGAVDTSTWKTYRNEKYGFEVRYPVKFTVLTGPSGYIELKIPENYDFILSFSPLRKRDSLTLDQFIHNDTSYGTEYMVEGEFQQEKILNINNITVYRYLRLFGSHNTMYYFFLRDQNSGVEVSYVNKLAGQNNPYADKFDQILSTFKFIE